MAISRCVIAYGCASSWCRLAYPHLGDFQRFEAYAVGPVLSGELHTAGVAMMKRPLPPVCWAIGLPSAQVYARSGRQTRRCFREFTPVGCESRPPMSDFAPRCDSQNEAGHSMRMGVHRPFCTGRREDLGLRCANCWHRGRLKFASPELPKTDSLYPAGPGRVRDVAQKSKQYESKLPSNHVPVTRLSIHP